MIPSIKFGWNLMKSVEGVALRKSYRKFCKIHQMTPTKPKEYKVWLRSDKNYRSSVLKSPAPYGPVLKKIQSAIKTYLQWSLVEIERKLWD